MSAACSVETLRDNLTLKLRTGKWLDDKPKALTAILISKDGEEIFEFPARVCYFDKLDNLQCYNASDDLPHSLGKDVYLEVFKTANNKFRINFLDKDGNMVDLDYSDVKNVIAKDGVNLEEYLRQKIYIKPIALENSEYRAAALYDAKGNEIGTLAEEMLYYGGNNVLRYISIDSPLSIYNGYHFYATINRMNDKHYIVNDQLDNEIQNIKVNDKYKLSVINNGPDVNINIPNIDSKNIKYNILNKIIEENDLCYQLEIANKEKEALCKELDKINIEVFGEHHKCVSELAKANFIMDQATYDTDTYM